MPRYNARGDIAAGIGGAIVSRNRKVIAQPAGGAVWLDDERIIYARKTGEPDRWGLRAHNGQTEIPIEATDQGATHLYAGGGVWAASVGPGYRSNGHPSSTTVGLKGMGPDGTLAYCRDYQSGLGLILRARSGQATVVLPESLGMGARDVHIQSATVATWVSRDRIRSNVGHPIVPEGVCHRPRVTAGRHLLYILSDPQGERLLLQVDWEEPVGYVLLDAPPNGLRAFRPDALLMGEGVRVCWSLTEAEGPANLRETVVDLSRPPVDLRRGPASVPVPPPPVQHEEIPMSIALVRAWRDRYDAVPPGKVRGFLISNGVAWELRATGAGLLDKRSGTDSTVAYDGKHFPADIIVERDGDHYDILQDGDGAAIPTWQPKGKIPSAWRWVSPYDPAVLERALGVVTEPGPTPPPGDPPPEPPPPPPSTGDPVGDEILARLRSIDQTLRALARHLGV